MFVFPYVSVTTQPQLIYFLRFEDCDKGPKSLSHVPLPISALDLFQNYLDILGTPKRYFFELLAFFASASHEKERLEYFADTNSADSQVSPAFSLQKCFANTNVKRVEGTEELQRQRKKDRCRDF